MMVIDQIQIQEILLFLLLLLVPPSTPAPAPAPAPVAAPIEPALTASNQPHASYYKKLGVPTGSIKPRAHFALATIYIDHW